MSMFKKIKSLFVVEEEVVKKAITEQNKKNKGKSFEAGKKKEFKLDVGDVSRASLDQFLKVLADAMEANNMEGYDYLEFKQATRSLDKLEADESKRFVTAYTMATTMGANKKGLLESASFYLDILKKEEVKFQQSLEKQVESKIQSKEQSVSGLKERRKKKEEQIKKLQEEIKGIDGKLLAVKEEVEASSKKLGSVKNSFHTAYELVVKQIREDIQKIEKLIK